MYTLMDLSSASVLILSGRLLDQKSQFGRHDAQGLMEADLYFPKTAQRGILSPAPTVLEKKIGHTGGKAVDDSRVLTNLMTFGAPKFR